ncbi:hypothetical protein [Rossellomorea marisflavi]
MERSEKIIEIGTKAKVLIDLHLENPVEFSPEYVLEKLLCAYTKLGFYYK